MAVAVVLEFDGATLDQYDQIRESMGLEAEGPAPPGALFHWVTATDDGFRVTDVWESREAFDRFAQEKIGPLSAQAGVETQPEITEYAVHNYHTPG